MGRSVAMVRFEDGAELFCVFCNTTDMVVGRELFDTEELARSARDAHEAARCGRGTSVLHGPAPAGVETTEAAATIYPNWQYQSLDFSIPTRASRRLRWLTGPKCLDDVAEEHRGDGFFAPPPRPVE